jgi:hypothetical protein
MLPPSLAFAKRWVILHIPENAPLFILKGKDNFWTTDGEMALLSPRRRKKDG